MVGIISDHRIKARDGTADPGLNLDCNLDPEAKRVQPGPRRGFAGLEVLCNLCVVFNAIKDKLARMSS